MSKEQVNKTVANFQDKLPRPGIDALTVDWCDLEENRPHSWPNSNKPGVYVFLNSDESLLYIGKASSGRDLKTRLRGYFDRNMVVKESKQGQKAEGTRYVGLLGLPPDHGFEAPAIEEWLITHLHPSRNKVIRNKQSKDAVRKAERALIKKYPEEYKVFVKRFRRSEGG